MVQEPLITGGVVGLAFAIIRFAERALDKRNGNDTKDKIKALYDLHNRFDDDGKPLWYVPHALITDQKEIIDKLTTCAMIQKETVNLLERLCRKMDA